MRVGSVPQNESFRTGRTINSARWSETAMANVVRESLLNATQRKEINRREVEQKAEVPSFHRF